MDIQGTSPGGAEFRAIVPQAPAVDLRAKQVATLLELADQRHRILKRLVLERLHESYRRPIGTSAVVGSAVARMWEWIQAGKMDAADSDHIWRILRRILAYTCIDKVKGRRTVSLSAIEGGDLESASFGLADRVRRLEPRQQEAIILGMDGPWGDGLAGTLGTALASDLPARIRRLPEAERTVLVLTQMGLGREEIIDYLFVNTQARWSVDQVKRRKADGLRWLRLSYGVCPQLAPDGMACPGLVADLDGPGACDACSTAWSPRDAAQARLLRDGDGHEPDAADPLIRAARLLRLSYGICPNDACEVQLAESDLFACDKCKQPWAPDEWTAARSLRFAPVRAR